MNEQGYNKAINNAERQIQLDTSIRNEYPIITSVEGLETYRKKEMTYASFALRKTPLLFPILETALIRASDSKDSAFCEHANEHKNFQEVIENLVNDLKNRKVRMVNQPIGIEIPASYSQGNITEVLAHRLIVEGESRIRPTFRPGPNQLAIEFQNRVEERNILEEKRNELLRRTLRKSALEYGMPFAILTAVYAGVEPEKALEIFDNKQFRKEFQEKRGLSGITHAKVPHKNDLVSFVRFYCRMREMLVVNTNKGVRSNFVPLAYFDALEHEFPQEYLKDFSPQLSQFVESDTLVIPRAVFAGLDEMAQRNSSLDFKDPERTEYIESTYGAKGTTRMVTAYYESNLQPEITHFQHLF
ncbi:MAG TPA: hypothetical protein VLF89_01635 [Candidatus Saccharimonadales bacterium]|nr:hypothetical protein [Candidatus Saccharimonadales bacterium]